MPEQQLSKVFDNVARAERRAASLTMLLLLAVAAAAVWLVWQSTGRYRELQAQIDEADQQLRSKRNEMDRHNAEVETLVKHEQRLTAELNDKLAEVQRLHAQAQQLAADLKVEERVVPAPPAKKAEARKRIAQFAEAAVKEASHSLPAVALTTRVEPSATAKELRKAADGTQIYEFSLWLKVPKDVAAAITKVVYKFDHPTFRVKEYTASDEDEGFRVKYNGWGALRRVDITIYPRDGEPQTLHFDMLKALGWD